MTRSLALQRLRSEGRRTRRERSAARDEALPVELELDAATARGGTRRIGLD